MTKKYYVKNIELTKKEYEEVKMKKKKRSRGRPKIENPRSSQMWFRCTEEEEDVIREMAKNQKMSVSGFLYFLVFGE